MEDLLELLANLQAGDTISMVDGSLVVTKSKSWYTFFLRRFVSGDDRHNTFLYVNNIISTAIYSGIKIQSDVIQGIINLKFTYGSDSDFCNQIDELISKIEKRNSL